MPSGEPRYTFDESRIVHEVLDREVMLVDLDKGYYYVLEGSGVDIWQLLSAGATVPKTTEVLLGRYSAGTVDVKEAVRGFVQELVDAELLTPTVDEAVSESPDFATSSPSGTNGESFALPVMYKYTDMANLIQMDPIREFDETGWPKRRAFTPRTRA